MSHEKIKRARGPASAVGLSPLLDRCFYLEDIGVERVGHLQLHGAARSPSPRADFSRSNARFSIREVPVFGNVPPKAFTGDHRQTVAHQRPFV